MPSRKFPHDFLTRWSYRLIRLNSVVKYDTLARTAPVD